MTHEPERTVEPEAMRDSSRQQQSQRKEWLELALEANQTGIWEYCLESDRFTWSDSCSPLFGIARARLPQTYAQLMEWICPRDRETFARAWQQTLSEQSPFTREYGKMMPDGRKRWFEQQGKFVAAIGGRGPRLLGLIKAIDCAPEPEPQPLEVPSPAPSPDRDWHYEQILDAISDMILVKGPHSRIVWANKAFRDFYGMNNEQLRDLIDAPFNEPDYTLQYIKDDARVFETGETLVIPGEAVTRYDGELFRLQTVKSSVRNAEGQIVLTVGVSRPISKLVEAELHQREESLRHINSVLPGAIFQYEAHIDLGTGRFTYASSTIEELFEISPVTLVEKLGLLWTIIAPEDIPHVQVSIARAVRENTPWSDEFRITTASGKQKWIAGKTEPFFREGSISRHNGIFIDITDRKALEQQALEQQELLDTFVTASPVGMAILDAQLRYININETLAGINGKPAAEHIGRAISEMLPQNIVPVVEELCQQVLTTGQPIVGLEATNRDYTTPDNIRTQLVSYFPLRRSSDRPLLVGIVTYDITDRKRAEAALAASEARNRAFIYAIPDLVFRLNRDGFYLDFFMPPAEPLLVPIEQIIGNNVRDLLPEFLAELSLTYADRALTTRQLECFEYQLPSGGELRDYEARFSAINDEEVMVIVRNITDRKRTEAALAASEARLRAFIQAIPDIMFRLDRHGNYLDYLAPPSALLIPAEELIGSNIRHSLPEAVAEQTLMSIQQALATKQLECFEYQLLMGDNFVDYEARFSAVNDEEVMVIVRNITDRKRAEAALAASEARLRAFVEALPDMIFRLSRTGRFIDCIAPPSVSLLMPVEELIGRDIRQILPEFLAERVLAYNEQAVETGQLESFEYQLPVGERLYDYEARISAVNDRELMVIVRNITDRKRAEATRARLYDILESTSDYIGTIDIQRNPLFINRAWRTLIGLAPEEELVGLSMPTFHPQWAIEVMEEQGIPSAIRDGTWQGETALLDARGREIPVSQVIIVHRNDDGAPESISTIMRDISNLKAAEVKLEEKARLADFRADVDAALTQEENLAVMLSRCTEATVSHLEAAFARIWTLNPELQVLELQASSGLYTHLNGAHARIPFGQYKIGSIAALGKPYLTNRVLEEPLVDRAWAEREGLVAFAGYPLIVDGGTIGVIAMFSRNPLTETTLDALNLASYEIAIGIRRQQAENDLRQRTAELEQTLSELQKTQAQLIQTEKMSSLGQMVAGIAHEINNPINFIHGNISHAKSYIGGLIELVKLYRKTYDETTPEIEEKIEEIELDYLMHDLWKLLASMRVGSDRIRKIVLSLRNFARLDEAEMKPVNLHEGIDSTLLVLQHRLRNIQVQREYARLPPVECYAGQFNQVLLNILSNAIDALETLDSREARESENPACITITTERLVRDWVAVAIADNGPGMPETVRQKLFDPFFTTKPVGQGTGLGLSISYQIIVEKHGGRLECISAPGRGTTLRIEIPIQQATVAR